MPAYPLPGQGRDAGWNDAFFAEWQADLPLHGLQHYVRVYGTCVCVASCLSHDTASIYLRVCRICLLYQSYTMCVASSMSEYVLCMYVEEHVACGMCRLCHTLT